MRKLRRDNVKLNRLLREKYNDGKQDDFQLQSSESALIRALKDMLQNNDDCDLSGVIDDDVSEDSEDSGAENKTLGIIGQSES